MATGDKKRTLEKIHNLFGDKTEEKPKLLQMIEMMSTMPQNPVPKRETPLKPPSPGKQAQTALETQYPFTRGNSGQSI